MEAPSLSLSDDQQLAWLALMRAPNTGPRTLNPLLADTPDPQALFRHPPTQAPEQLRQYLRSPDWHSAEQDLAWLKSGNNHLLPITHADYPSLLQDLADPPPLLYLKGDPELLHLPQLGMVGSRNATRSAIQSAHQFAAFLAANGIAITSGMALGIDGAGHEGALQVQGKTLAVVGTGLDRIYPAKHRDLAHRIAEHGLLVSEFPPGTPPLPGHFPRRNRLIAALSVGVLVVEAALKSGSLITARLAAELGREVFAMPGSIHNPLSRGCHALIRDGAKLVETGEHIVEELAAGLGQLTANQSSEEPEETSTTLDAEHAELLDNMGYDPVSTDDLVARSRFSAAEVSSMLLLLELEGHVSSEQGGMFTRIGKLPL